MTNDVVRLIGDRPFESHISYQDIVDSSWKRKEGSRMSDPTPKADSEVRASDQDIADRVCS